MQSVLQSSTPASDVTQLKSPAAVVLMTRPTSSCQTASQRPMLALHTLKSASDFDCQADSMQTPMHVLQAARHSLERDLQASTAEASQLRKRAQEQAAQLEASGTEQASLQEAVQQLQVSRAQL